MGVRIKFVRDDAADGVEITVRAKAETEEVTRILRALGGEEGTLVCGALSEGFAGGVAIRAERIVILSKSGRYVCVKTVDGEYVLTDPLYKIEEKLDRSQFVRISQSEIVNLRYVEGWRLAGGGIIRVDLAGGISSYTSRRYAAEIKKALRGNRGSR